MVFFLKKLWQKKHVIIIHDAGEREKTKGKKKKKHIGNELWANESTHTQKRNRYIFRTANVIKHSAIEEWIQERNTIFWIKRREWKKIEPASTQKRKRERRIWCIRAHHEYGLVVRDLSNNAFNYISLIVNAAAAFDCSVGLFFGFLFSLRSLFFSLCSYFVLIRAIKNQTHN